MNPLDRLSQLAESVRASAALDEEHAIGQKMVFGVWRPVSGHPVAPPTPTTTTTVTPQSAAPQPKAKKPKALHKTFDAAHDASMAHLEKEGWKVKRGLKTPHATSPDGKHRLWFKGQSIHHTHSKTGSHNVGDAHSLHLYDLKNTSPEDVLAAAHVRMKNSEKDADE